jgi:hypothetical protein
VIVIIRLHRFNPAGIVPQQAFKDINFHLDIQQRCLKLGNTFVTTDLPLTIRNAVYRHEMEEYIIERAAWDRREIYDMVDWDA